MRLAKSILYAAAAWMLIYPSVGWQASWDDPGYSADASRVYEVDEDRDGTADRLIILEDSDTLA